MAPVRVMIVDDSVVIRRLLSDILAADPSIEVCATASNGRLALAKLDTIEVDVVVLDIEMPELDGLDTLRAIRRRDRRLPVIMFSTLTEHGARETISALAAGASDYVTKPANVGSVNESREAVRTQLVPKVLALAGRPVGRLPHAQTTPRPSVAISPVVRPIKGSRPAVRPKVLVIGSSTGGPEALVRLLPQLPANLNIPVLIVQHMPPLFTTMLAERLNRTCALNVVEATQPCALAPGTIYLAPGDFHLEVTVSGSRPPRFNVAPSRAAPENFCRPSVDVLFRSAAKAYEDAVLGVVLTGMGSDGRAGSQSVVEHGGSVLVQDRSSSVVWGMPGSVADAGLADEILPLDQLAAAIGRRLAESPDRTPVSR
jgi:two-component system, chemotaxis family, protein-glutamate methylesterase/glutaminase